MTMLPTLAPEKATRADEREQCCKDICVWCLQGIAVERDSPRAEWWHWKSGALDDDKRCDAGYIRERAWKETGQQ